MRFIVNTIRISHLSFGTTFCLQLSGQSKETAVPSSRVGRLWNYSGMSYLIKHIILNNYLKDLLIKKHIVFNFFANK